MTINSDIIDYFKRNPDCKIIDSPTEWAQEMYELYGRAKGLKISSYNMISDYCYNKYSTEWNKRPRLFEKIGKSTYKYLGKGYPYDGEVRDKDNNIVGYWTHGSYNGNTMQPKKQQCEPQNIYEKIKIIANSEKYSDIRNCDEYYHQKAFDKYNEFLNYKIENEKINNLLNGMPDKTHYTTDSYLKKFSNESEEYKFLHLLLVLLAYSDIHAWQKNTLNEYNNKRTIIGTTGIRQNVWLQNFLWYKRDENAKLTPNVENYFSYMENRLDKLAILSNTHIEKIFKALPELLNIQIDCKIKENKNILLTKILYTEPEIKALWYIEQPQKEKNMKHHPLNQILYGPPGTGKTYNTISKAVEICDCEYYDENENDYEKLREKFNELRNSGRVEFITFHQSYSYEEFVEGIKPIIPDKNLWGEESENLKYIGKDGIFKEICARAKSEFIKKTGPRLKTDFTQHNFFKMSLGANWESETEDIFNYCMQNDVIALGWGEELDYTNANSVEDIKNILVQNNKELKNNFDFNIRGIERFKLKMKIGDIVLISNGTRNIKAIAQIIGDYEHDKDADIRFTQFRKVKWLYKGEDIPVANFLNKALSQQAIYEFCDGDVDKKYFNELFSDTDEDPKPFVLIIDEINRGNISKIFGELITLIENDKREGNKHGLKVVLPYSQKEFSVPNNLYIIGTMNTSDRSIASVDIALRRRFKFVEMMPKPNLVASFNIEFEDIFKKLNKKISILLDRDHQIGHSYFIKEKYQKEGISTLKQIWFYEIMPLLNEYFYGDWEKLNLIISDFIKEENVPAKLKDECDKHYEFKTIDDFSDKEFENALKNLDENNNAD